MQLTALRQGFLGLLLLGLTAGSVRADAMLDFDLGGAAGGAINFTGGLNPLTGTNIPIRLVTGSATPLNNGQTVPVFGQFNSTTKVYSGTGLLNFSTGNLISFDPVTKIFTFSGSGSISITGYVPSIGITSTTIPLLKGSFISATFDANTGSTSLFFGNGTDIPNPTLVSHYFTAPPLTWTFSGTILSGIPTLLAGTHAFRNTVRPASVDILNTAVPEVGSILLLGTGLLGTAILVRRRSRLQS